MRMYLFLIHLLVSLQVTGQQVLPFILVNQTQKAVIVLPKTELESVQLAVKDLVSDVQKITGKTLEIATAKVPGRQAVFIETQQNTDAENYRIQTKNGNLYISGSNALGTISGIYYFTEKYLGVDPMYFWNNREPAKQRVLAWQEIDVQSQTPTFKYRGWFINDEDLLTEWQESNGKRTIDYPYYQQVVSPKTMAKVCETALRLRFNLIIPASFIDIRNPAEAALVQEATRRGLFVSMHHVEPMGVSAFSYFNYWKEKEGTKPGVGPPLFSYFSNKEKVEEVWELYAKEWAKYPNLIWQIGLRGIADRPMWLADPNTPQTDADRGKLISEAMAFQMQLIKEVDKRPNPPVTTTLWAEGSTLNQAGYLQIPENVTIVFADNSPGWRWQADFFQTKRSPKNSYGVYYHHQLWGSGPHLVPIVSPAQTHKVLSQAIEKGDTTYCIMNVSNVREFSLGIAASAAMLVDFKNFSVQAFNAQWFKERFGNSSKPAQQVYQAYFESFEVNDKTGTPILMDGQINGLAAGILSELKWQLTDSVQYQALLKKKHQETDESKWIKSAIGDMLSGNLTNKELLQRVIRQKNGLLKAENMAQQIENNAFFLTDFAAHLKIMLGLTAWLENCLEAKIAADEHNLTKTKIHLQKALECFSVIREGQRLKSQGEKWRNWYRGDKKMNLSSKENLTTSVVEILK
ncbi:hypothetical protein GVN20_21660 [Runella sp. CRIBMP]|uniref:glycosyl hydrolase 115 family protein n=1 Tax=Runella sp. CRIBMP TaxID=2683261 RepID=UPI0014123882|nr:glycosyl hydrolase 115 family protein [Runella sp. CRIBMP]NBB21979.1 hypothetical protein [Runella sp. CRIBMP]